MARAQRDGFGFCLLTLAGLSGLLTSCASPPLPLHPYNQAWRGELRLRDRTLPLRLRLFVLPGDRAEATRDEWRYQHLFAEIEISGLGPVAAAGSASHNDGTARGTYSPYVPGREFLELSTKTANALVDESEHPPTGEPYSRRYAALLALFSSQSTLPQRELVFAGELGPGHRLEGSVFLDESAQGDCVRYVGVECDMWNVRFKETRVGTFSAELDPSEPARTVASDVFETPSFRFAREQTPDAGTSWTVRARSAESQR